MNIFNGREIASELQSQMKRQVESKEKTRLAIVVLGSDKSSLAYINGVKKTAEELSIDVELVELSETTTTQELIQAIKMLNKNSSIHGIMLQMPLPQAIDQIKVFEAINPLKDVDCLTSENQGKLFNNHPRFVPCTPMAIMETLDYYDIELEGKDVVVVGRSDIVGKPIALLLLARNATVTICHSRTQMLKEKTKSADILVVAVGKKHFIDKSMVKENSIVIDVGINIEDNKIYGDVDFDAVSEKANYITPVPGGIGSITNTLLLKNTVKARELTK